MFQRKEKENSRNGHRNYKESTQAVEILRGIDKWNGNNRHAG